MSNQQLIINQRYFQQRLDNTSSINMENRGNSDDAFDINTGAIANFLDSIGIKKLPEDFNSMIETLLSSSLAKIFTCGLNTFPNSDWKSVFGAMQELGILSVINPEHHGIGNYVHLKSGIINFERRH